MNATQIEVSNGSLNIVNIGIKFFEQNDISVSLGTSTPLVLGTDYIWNSSTAIKFLSTANTPGGLVPNGIEVLIRRSTDDDEMLNIFDGGAPFSRAALDENFEQLLFLSQEFREGLGLDGLRNDLNMNGYRVVNTGTPVNPQDAANKQYVDGIVNRSIRSSTDTLNPLPSMALRAGKLLSFDVNGQPVVVSPASGSAAELAADLANGTDSVKGANQVAYDGVTSVKQAIDAVRVGQFPVVDTVADILNLLKTGPKACIALGYSTPGLGGGVYRLDPTDTTSAAIQGFLIVATDGGRWKLQHYGVLDSSQFGCSPALANNAPAMQVAINTAAATGAKLTMQPGVLTFTSPIEFKNGTIYEGRGVDVISNKGTRFEYTGTGDFATIKNAINGSTSANIDISGIWFSSSTLSANSGLLFDTASSVVVLTRCRFNSNAGGLILDQSELWDVRFCSFLCSTSTAFGTWLVNGTEKNATAQSFFTNRVAFWGCEWNGASGSVAVYDDGGAVHAFLHCNFNACSTHIRATAVNGLLIHGGEYEVSAAQTIIIGLVKRSGAASSLSGLVEISNAYFYNNLNQPILATVANAIGSLTLRNNSVNTPAGNVPYSGVDVATSPTNLIAENNQQLGAGSGALNNRIKNAGTSIAWTSSATQPAIGNGIIAARYDRDGTAITYRFTLQFGSSTSAGTGQYRFTLPHALQGAGTTVGEVGAVYMLIPGNAYYAGVARREPGTQVVTVVCGNNPIGAAAPAAMVNGTIIEFQITVQAVSPI